MSTRSRYGRTSPRSPPAAASPLLRCRRRPASPPSSPPSFRSQVPTVIRPFTLASDSRPPGWNSTERSTISSAYSLAPSPTPQAATARQALKSAAGMEIGFTMGSPLSCRLSDLNLRILYPVPADRGSSRVPRPRPGSLLTHRKTGTALPPLQASAANSSTSTLP